MIPAKIANPLEMARMAVQVHGKNTPFRSRALPQQKSWWAMQTISCPQCGELLPTQARFCGRCGQALMQTPQHKVTTQAPAKRTSGVQTLLSTISGQLHLPTDTPTYLKGSAAPLFTDVFISYSRQDKAFVRQLFQALAEAKRAVWVDWADIPPTADWQQEIYTGIETASTFVFVLSPDSIRSVPCQKELEHALQTKKRIIPLVYRMVDPKLVKEELQKLNWIFFAQRELFDFACQQLLFALETDLDYWHQSARFLTGAKEWEKKGKEPSRTLRGNGLKEAERWLAEGTGKSPPPGPPITDFITASRTQRKRARSISLALVLLFVLTAGTAAYFFLHLAPDPTLVTVADDSGTGSLRWAILNAPAGSTITFAPTAFPSEAQQTIALTSASLTINKNVTIRGPSTAHLTIINGIANPNAEQYYGLTVEASAKVTLSDFTFHIPLTVNAGTLFLKDSSILSNTAKILGSGVTNLSGTVTISNSLISGISSGFGGIENLDGTLTISQSSITNNTATLSGGGIYNGGGIVTITNSTISGNKAPKGNGGGIANEGSAEHPSNETVTITNSTISGNSAVDGGGIANDAGSLQDFTITSTVSITNSTISGNTAASTVPGNPAEGDGGAVYNRGYPVAGSVAAVTLTFCTLYGNSADDGGGLFSQEFDERYQAVQTADSTLQVKLTNSLLLANQTPGQGKALAGVQIISGGYNLWQDVSGGLATDHLLPDSTNLAQFIDPTLQSSVGPDGKPAPTQTLALLPTPGNPAIDVIPLTACHIQDPATNQPIMTDQRGVPRPTHNKALCDVGAYES